MSSKDMMMLTESNSKPKYFIFCEGVKKTLQGEVQSLIRLVFLKFFPILFKHVSRA